ncbi:Alpha/Beta hydrolase protein [Aspergillus californicus]
MSTTHHYHETPNGTTIHYTQTGLPTGQLIILLHGLGGSTETFTPLLPNLNPDTNRLISVDLEGSGKTPLSSPSVTLSIPRYVKDLEYLVTSLQSTAKLILIGHSLGAIIATQYAALHPESIHGLALLGTGRSIASIPAARERMLALAARTRKDGISAAAETAAISNFPTTGFINQSLRDTIRDAVSQCDAESYARTCEAIASEDHTDPDYSRITAPTVLVAGGGDGISPPERSVAVQRLIGDNARVEVLDGVGHQFILQDLEGCSIVLRRFLERL